MEDVEAVEAKVEAVEAGVEAVEALTSVEEAVEAEIKDVEAVEKASGLLVGADVVVGETHNFTSMKLHGGSVSVDCFGGWVHHWDVWTVILISRILFSSESSFYFWNSSF